MGKLTRFRFLWPYVSASKLKLFLALSSLTFLSLAALVYPWLLKFMVDQYGGSRSTALSVPALGLALALLLSLAALVGYHCKLYLQVLGYRLRNTLRVHLYWTLLRRSLSFHQHQQVGEISARATEDIAKLQSIFINLLTPLFQNALYILGCIILMSFLNWVATLIVIAVVLPPCVYFYLASAKLQDFSARGQAMHAQANAFFEETLVGIREIKAFAREKRERERYAGIIERALATEVESAKLEQKVDQGLLYLFYLILLGIYYVGTTQTIFPDWTLGGVVAFYFYAYTITLALLSSGRLYQTYQGIAGSLDRIAELIEPEDFTRQPSVAGVKRKLLGKVEFKDVSFQYEPRKPVLMNLSFILEPGSWLLITGASGSGKSTIVNLVMRFYEPQSGVVLIDSIPMQDWDISFLRRQVGYVGQEPLLFHGTIKENIFFCQDGVDERQLQESLRIAQLEEFISELPDGLDTMIGERGLTLSGGQRARVAIARAIVFNPTILILDEANAMVEKDLEQEFWAQLANSRKDKTTIILSHHPENIPHRYTTLGLSGVRPQQKSLGERL